ncbi:MAG: GPP34 family phosphoprotein [Candidatus Heimdallarchaeota archaeon]|nr:GPP34 family phosphoprotein [Candidatus Heimdallarchaeota archaeon]
MLIAEKIFVLTIDEESGKMNTPFLFSYAITGAVLMELLFLKKITLEKQRFKVIVHQQDSMLTGKKILDYILEEINNSDEKSLGKWIRKYGNFQVQKITELLIETVKEEGIIRDVIDGNQKGIFKKTTYPLSKPEIKNEILEEIREGVATETQPTKNALALISLLYATWTWRSLLDKKDRKAAKKKMNKLFAKREKSLVREYSESIYYVAKEIRNQVSTAAA